MDLVAVQGALLIFSESSQHLQSIVRSRLKVGLAREVPDVFVFLYIYIYIYICISSIIQASIILHVIAKQGPIFLVVASFRLPFVRHGV